MPVSSLGNKGGLLTRILLWRRAPYLERQWLGAADSLIQTVMRERGYPVDDFDTRAGDLSVDHPDVVENYRAGHGIAVAHDRGKAGTEELRKAVQHYRVLFILGKRNGHRDFNRPGQDAHLDAELGKSSEHLPIEIGHRPGF